MDQARALIDEAARAARVEWRRALLSSARMKLDEARAGVHDGEEALQGYSSPVADMMRSTVETRRTQIEKLTARIDEQEQAS